MPFTFLDSQIPFWGMLVLTALLVIVPALATTLMFGGRGLATVFLLLSVLLAGYTWQSLAQPPGPRSTGMEGIVLLVMPILWLGMLIGVCLVYFAVRWAGFLPRQRRGRDGQT